MTQFIRITVNVLPESKTRFEAYCKDKGYTMSEYLRAFITAKINAQEPSKQIADANDAVYKDIDSPYEFV